MKSKEPPKKKSRAKKHTRVEHQKFADTKLNMSPFALYLYAEGFLRAAKAVEPTGKPFEPARMYLLCRVLELSLTAFLSCKGHSLEKLAGGKFGHDLANLLAEAEIHGLTELVRLEQRQIEVIKLVSTYYSEKVFEYPALQEAIAGYPQMPDAVVFLSSVEAIVRAIKATCSQVH